MSPRTSLLWGYKYQLPDNSQQACVGNVNCICYGSFCHPFLLSYQSLPPSMFVGKGQGPLNLDITHSTWCAAQLQRPAPPKHLDFSRRCNLINLVLFSSPFLFSLADTFSPFACLSDASSYFSALTLPVYSFPITATK